MKNMKKDNAEQIIRGASVSSGIAMGKAFLFKKRQPVIHPKVIHKSEIKKHVRKFKKACDLTKRELHHLQESHLDESTIDIIEAQIAMVDDPELADQVERLITLERYSVGHAIQKVFENYLKMLARSDNAEARERAIDIMDTRDRLIQLANNEYHVIQANREHILVAKELSPREVIKLAGHKIKGIIMDHGGPTSHAAIIARALGIPAVVGTQKIFSLVKTNDLIALDGDNGSIILRPASVTIRKIEEKLEEQKNSRARYQSICKQPSVTTDDHSFVLKANIEFSQELDSIKSCRAEGIGLLRTESIYLLREHFGDQKRQEVFYTSILEGTGDKPVTIRLFDAGGDKFFNMGGKEPNPFLGWRGIRMLLDEPALLHEQLKAILKVAGKFQGRVRILVPMISGIDEIFLLKEHLHEAQNELEKQGCQTDRNIPVGIMVEVPGVVIQADLFAKEVDFFSIGTNDLTQYTLAVDRGNELIGKLYNQRHPAVWSMICQTVQAARKQGIKIAVCGELAADPEAAACLLGLGIDELSMSPARIPVVKKLLITKEYKQMKKLSSSVLECVTLSEVNKLFNDWKNA